MTIRSYINSRFATAVHEAHVVPFVLFLAVAATRRRVFKFLIANVTVVRCFPCAVGSKSIYISLAAWLRDVRELTVRWRDFSIAFSAGTFAGKNGTHVA